VRTIIGDPRDAATAALELLMAVAAATLVVAALQSAAPPAGLGVVYLLAVLEVAVRRGQRPAIVAAVLCVLALNYLFAAPRERFAIAHTQDLVELLVFLIVALVVGRLAARARSRAAEADARALAAAAREREATLLAQAASAILSRHDRDDQVTSIERLVATATGSSRARIVGPASATPDGELAVRLGAGEPLWLAVSRDSHWDEGQLTRIAGPLGKLFDVARVRERATEQTAEIEAARRAETARTAVLHAISHDLRSPLTAITTAAYALRSEQVSEAERGELVEVIEGEGARLTKLVDDLLDLSMIEAGAVRPRADWCDLHEVVVSAAEPLRDGHHIAIDLPADLPLVRVDAAQVERVFSNLLTNAVKFSPPGTPVRVSGSAEGGRVTVRVVDRGPGIPRPQRARVFEPFFRARSAPGAGAGLGLAICRGFVEANGGRILLQADSGKGTSFAVSFPVQQLPAPAEPARR